MVLENYLAPDYQLQNEVHDDEFTLSPNLFENGYPSQNGLLSQSGPSMNLYQPSAASGSSMNLYQPSAASGSSMNLYQPSAASGSSMNLYQPSTASGSSMNLYQPSASGSSMNLYQPVAPMVYPNSQFMPGDMNMMSVHGNTPNSAISLEDSSLITDTNSPLSGASNMLGNVNNITETLAPNGVRIAGSSNGDHQSAHQQPTGQANQSYALWCRRQGEPLSNPVPLSQPLVQSMMNVKKPRLEFRQEDPVSPFPMQSLPYNQSPMQSHDPALATVMSKPPLLQNQPQNQPQNMQTSLSVPEAPRPEMQLLPPSRRAVAALNSGLCARQLMSYINHQRRRPPDNEIGFWKNFVKTFYAPCAKRRWCLPNQNNGVRPARGVFSQSTMNAMKCDFCGSQSRKAFEATFETLPRLKKFYFDGGILDELLYLDFPNERRLQSGFMMLQFAKAVQETVYRQFRVVHEGHLRVIFTLDLKIISWEFCVSNHEEIIPRRLLAEQIRELAQDAARCQRNVRSRGADKIPTQSFMTNCNKLAASGRELAKNLELPLVNDLGFPKQFIRSLQVSEVFNCMRDLVSYSLSNNTGPIETLRKYPEECAKAKRNRSLIEAQMLHDQGPDLSNFTGAGTNNNTGGNFKTPNSMLHAPNAREQATIYPTNYHQNPPMEQPLTTFDTSALTPEPHQSLYNKASSSHPLSQQASAHESRVISDLLELFQDVETNLEQTNDVKGKGKAKIIYDVSP